MDRDAVGLGIALTEVRFSSWFEDRGDSTSGEIELLPKKQKRWPMLGAHLKKIKDAFGEDVKETHIAEGKKNGQLSNRL